MTGCRRRSADRSHCQRRALARISIHRAHPCGSRSGMWRITLTRFAVGDAFSKIGCQTAALVLPRKLSAGRNFGGSLQDRFRKRPAEGHQIHSDKARPPDPECRISRRSAHGVSKTLNPTASLCVRFHPAHATGVHEKPMWLNLGCAKLGASSSVSAAVGSDPGQQAAGHGRDAAPSVLSVMGTTRSTSTTL